MNNTRMNLTYLTNFNYLHHLAYYYIFLLKFSYLNSPSSRVFFYKTLIKNFFVLKYIRHDTEALYCFKNNYNNKIQNFYDTLKIETKYPSPSSLVYDNEDFLMSTKSKSVFLNRFDLSKNFFFFNFLFGFSSFSSFFSHHRDFFFFYLKDFKKNLIVTDASRFLNRWKNAQNFIFNIYYYNFFPLLFGSFEFKNEILSVNWHNSKFDLVFWKYSFNFFIFKNNRYSIKITHFYNKLNSLNVNFFFISNPHYHYKNLYYFRKLNFFTLAPISSNLSPWLVTYPIPASSVNFLIEFFFLKFLLLTQKKALQFKYFTSRKIWANFVLARFSNFI